MWQNVEQPEAEHKLHFACKLDKAIDKHSEYVEHSAFSRQHLLHNRTTILLLYVHCDLVLRLSLNSALYLH
jgi:hypothetical protein